MKNAVTYLHSLVVVLNSPLLLWLLWTVGMTIAKENPVQRESTTLDQIIKHYSSKPATLKSML